MRITAAIVLTLMFVPAALAQREVFTVDPGTSHVGMTLNTTHEVVHGTFHVQSGTIQFVSGQPTLSGSVIVSAASGSTGNRTRDRKMDSAVLKTGDYATVSFAPKSYAGSLAPFGDSTIQVSGVFTLLGTPHQLTIPMQIRTENARTIVHAHFIIPYVQWGLKNPSFMFWKADDDVALDLDLKGDIHSR